MADEVKRKRGRPKKVDTPTPIANEEKEQTIMSANKPTYQEIKEGVGTVKTVPQNITLDAIQARWRNVFGKYATLGFDSIMEKWSTSSNPYLSSDKNSSSEVEIINPKEEPPTNIFIIDIIMIAINPINNVFPNLVKSVLVTYPYIASDINKRAAPKKIITILSNL